MKTAETKLFDLKNQIIANHSLFQKIQTQRQDLDKVKKSNVKLERECSKYEKELSSAFQELEPLKKSLETANEENEKLKRDHEVLQVQLISSQKLSEQKGALAEEVHKTRQNKKKLGDRILRQEEIIKKQKAEIARLKHELGGRQKCDKKPQSSHLKKSNKMSPKTSGTEKMTDAKRLEMELNSHEIDGDSNIESFCGSQDENYVNLDVEAAPEEVLEQPERSFESLNGHALSEEPMEVEQHQQCTEIVEVPALVTSQVAELEAAIGSDTAEKEVVTVDRISELKSAEVVESRAPTIVLQLVEQEAVECNVTEKEEPVNEILKLEKAQVLEASAASSSLQHTEPEPVGCLNQLGEETPAMNTNSELEKVSEVISATSSTQIAETETYGSGKMEKETLSLVGRISEPEESNSKIIESEKLPLDKDSEDSLSQGARIPFSDCTPMPQIGNEAVSKKKSSVKGKSLRRRKFEAERIGKIMKKMIVPLSFAPPLESLSDNSREDGSGSIEDETLLQKLFGPDTSDNEQSSKVLQHQSSQGFEPVQSLSEDEPNSPSKGVSNAPKLAKASAKETFSGTGGSPLRNGNRSAKRLSANVCHTPQTGKVQVSVQLPNLAGSFERLHFEVDMNSGQFNMEYEPQISNFKDIRNDKSGTHFANNLLQIESGPSSVQDETGQVVKGSKDPSKFSDSRAKNLYGGTGANQSAANHLRSPDGTKAVCKSAGSGHSNTINRSQSIGTLFRKRVLERKRTLLVKQTESKRHCSDQNFATSVPLSKSLQREVSEVRESVVSSKRISRLSTLTDGHSLPINRRNSIQQKDSQPTAKKSKDASNDLPVTQLQDDVLEIPGETIESSDCSESISEGAANGKKRVSRIVSVPTDAAKEALTPSLEQQENIEENTSSQGKNEKRKVCEKSCSATDADKNVTVSESSDVTLDAIRYFCGLSARRIQVNPQVQKCLLTMQSLPDADNKTQATQDIYKVLMNPLICPSELSIVETTLLFLVQTRRNIFIDCLTTEGMKPPFVSSFETTLLGFLFYLHNRKAHLSRLLPCFKETLVAMLFSGKHHTLFGSACLVRIHTAICRRQGDLASSRVLCYDLAVEKAQHSLFLIASVAGVWPQVLQTESDARPLMRTIHYWLMKSEISNPTLTLQSKTVLQKYCGCKYDPLLNLPQITSQILDVIRQSEPVCDKKLYECSKALELLYRFQEWKPARRDLIELYLMPILKLCLDDRTKTFLARTILQLLGLLCPPSNVASVTEPLVEILLKGKVCDDLQETVVMTLLKFKDPQIQTNISKWASLHRHKDNSLLKRILSHRKMIHS